MTLFLIKLIKVKIKIARIQLRTDIFSKILELHIFLAQGFINENFIAKGWIGENF